MEGNTVQCESSDGVADGVHGDEEYALNSDDLAHVIGSDSCHGTFY